MLVGCRQVFKSGPPHDMLYVLRSLDISLRSAPGLGWGIFVLCADSGELEDGAEVAPVAALGACDRGLDSLDLVFLWVMPGFLSLLRSWIVFYSWPTACAVGCILSPLRGWFCGWVCRGCILLQYDWRIRRFALGDWRGLGFVLDGGRCLGLADRNVRATQAFVFAGGAPAPHGSGPSSGCSIRYWRA